MNWNGIYYYFEINMWYYYLFPVWEPYKCLFLTLLYISNLETLWISILKLLYVSILEVLWASICSFISGSAPTSCCKRFSQASARSQPVFEAIAHGCFPTHLAKGI